MKGGRSSREENPRLFAELPVSGGFCETRSDTSSC